ncbi:MAG: 2-dehydropantoate 2-reductase N-terminal domain-containing protein [Actinomycetota bacterium]|nr:2-dehydropantoate 2-reductase N-terminal domain-containing protein [Actinomycetota bacterium]
MRVAVIGAGASGSTLACMLCEGGMDVVIYEIREDRVRDLHREGLRVRGAIDARVLPEVKAMGEPAEPFDAMVLAVPVPQTGEALRPLSPFVHRETLYLSLQEGGGMSELAQIVGVDRAGGGLCWISAMETTEGEVDVEGFHEIVIGACAGGTDDRIVAMVKAVNDVVPGGARYTDDLEREVWRRLRSAAAVSALCGLLGESPQGIRTIDEVDGLCREAVDECRRTASSVGMDIELDGSPWDEAVWERLKPPMLRDVESSRKTELESLGGLICKQAASTSVRVPVQSAMYSLMKEVESGRRKPGEAIFRELRRRIEEERGMTLL